MSIIFYHNKRQKEIALKSKREFENKKNIKIFTEIKPLDKFYLAENYHQKYYLQLTREIMNDFNKIYPNFKDIINSTAIAHINGYIKGVGNMKMLLKEINDLGLSEKGKKRLIQIVEGYGR